MKTIAVIIADDNTSAWRMKAINSFKFFHPDINLIHYSNEEIKDIIEKYNLEKVEINLRFVGPLILKEVWEKENPDLLIKIGNDTLTLGRFDEILNNRYDVAAGRNDTNLINNKDERINRPDEIKEIPNNEWVNADLIAIRNKNFLDEYVNLTLDYAFGRKMAINSFGKTYNGDCQMSLNVIFRNRGYNSLILDKDTSGVIYNASGNWTGGEDNRPACLQWHPNNWTSWKYIYFDGQKCIMPDLGIGCGNRVIKCLHHCGGDLKYKLSWDFFNEDFLPYLKKITGVN
jgi:hypothetical protein